jgi:hydrogenase 3 maturation protease
MWNELQSRLAGKRVVILGVGNPLRGDDAVGSVLAEKLHGHINAIALNAGDVPEDYLGRIIAARPDVVVIVDATETGSEPGSVALIEPEQLPDTSFSTHTLSLGMLATIVQVDTQADVFVLGIQPAVTTYGASLTPAVEITLDLLHEMLARCLPIPVGSD